MDFFSPLDLFDDDSEGMSIRRLFNRDLDTDEAGSFIDPSDPDLVKYRELLSKPTGSEDLIKEYINRRPRRDDSDTNRRRALGIIAGALGAQFTPESAQAFVDKPYTQAIKDWQLEGGNIATRARLIDQGRNREVQALRSLLQGKERFERDARNKEFQRDKLDQAEEWKALLREDTLVNRQRLDADRKHADEDRHFRMTLERDRFEESKRRDDERNAAKANDLEKTNKRLTAYASQHGIDTTVPGITAKEIATRLAIGKIANHPQYGQFLQADSTSPNGYRITDPAKASIITGLVTSLSQVYLQGRGF